MADAAASLSLNAPFALFGKAASYTPAGGGAAVSCRVILDRSDRDMQIAGVESAPFAEGITIEVRQSEIAAPARGGCFTIGVETFVIQDDPKSADAERLVWTCRVA